MGWSKLIEGICFGGQSSKNMGYQTDPIWSTIYRKPFVLLSNIGVKPKNISLQPSRGNMVRWWLDIMRECLMNNLNIHLIWTFIVSLTESWNNAAAGDSKPKHSIELIYIYIIVYTLIANIQISVRWSMEYCGSCGSTMARWRHHPNLLWAGSQLWIWLVVDR